ncbi:hypothetical protein MATL_G00068740 [Megalops atlanticus]|uniref:Uncharacterized protein n=1 Tax=Megalops atlanticus TaxID=7932 RepID=A0A9D3Q4Y6_MEGAT|nr:hypothetical protein MATL_G00068740 [Megalops atlanticus]
MTMEDSEHLLHHLHAHDHIQMGIFKETRQQGDATEAKSETVQVREVHFHPRRIPITRKFYAFYHAPIVKFWFNTVGSAGIVTAIEKTREMFMSEAGKITQKIRVWFSDYFNISDTIAIVSFFVGFGLRFGTGDLFIAGRIVYCLNIIFWFVRLLDIVAVNQYAGPYIMMIGKMVANMFYIVVIMAVILVSYGVPRKAILYPSEEPSWTLAKDVVFQPYWMMYGEVSRTRSMLANAYVKRLLVVCADNSEAKELCGPAVWLTPLLQAVYLFVQYILIVNLLIAFFNNVHLVSIFTCICRKRKKGSRTYGPKLFLTEEDRKRLHDFEEQCVETYFQEKDDQFHSGSEERIRVTSDRVETMCLQLKERASEASKVHNQITRELSVSKNLAPRPLDITSQTQLPVPLKCSMQEGRDLAESLFSRSGGDRGSPEHRSGKQPAMGCKVFVGTPSQHGEPSSLELQDVLVEGSSVEFGAFVGHKDNAVLQRSFRGEPLQEWVISAHQRRAKRRAFLELGCEWERVESSVSGRSPVSPGPESRAAAGENAVQVSPSQQPVPREEALNASTSLYLFRHTHLGARKDSIGSPFKTMDTSYQYSAVERNNLMRLSQSIPFTPVPPKGEPVTVYRLEELSKHPQ